MTRLEGPSSVRREAREAAWLLWANLDEPMRAEWRGRLRHALRGYNPMMDFLVETFGPVPAMANVRGTDE